MTSWKKEIDAPTLWKELIIYAHRSNLNKLFDLHCCKALQEELCVTCENGAYTLKASCPRPLFQIVPYTTDDQTKLIANEHRVIHSNHWSTYTSLFFLSTCETPIFHFQLDKSKITFYDNNWRCACHKNGSRHAQRWKKVQTSTCHVSCVHSGRASAAAVFVWHEKKVSKSLVDCKEWLVLFIRIASLCQFEQ